MESKKQIELLEECKNSYRKAIQKLANVQNPDGSWNYADNDYRVDPWTTSEIIISLLCICDDDYFNIDIIHELCLRGINWLVCNQNEDGGWWCICYSQDNESVIAATAYCIIAFDLFNKHFMSSPEIENSIDKGLLWILRNQNKDGGWRSGNLFLDNSQIGCTAFAVRALNNHSKKNGVSDAIQFANHFLTRYYNLGWNYSPLHKSDVSLTNYVLKMLIEL